jgi:hypothetical protein
VSDVSCPWCEAELELQVAAADEQNCPECHTTWRYDEEPVELALAA